MTEEQAFIAEYQQTIIDLGARLASYARLIAALQNQTTALRADVSAKAERIAELEKASQGTNV